MLPQIEVKERTGKQAKTCYGYGVGDTVYIMSLRTMTARSGIVRSSYSTMISVDLKGGGNQLVRPKEREKFRVLKDREEVVSLLRALVRGEIVKRETEIKNLEFQLEKIK